MGESVSKLDTICSANCMVTGTKEQRNIVKYTPKRIKTAVFHIKNVM